MVGKELGERLRFGILLPGRSVLLVVNLFRFVRVRDVHFDDTADIDRALDWGLFFLGGLSQNFGVFNFLAGDLIGNLLCFAIGLVAFISSFAVFLGLTP
jgi:hypothetical protein